MRLFLPVPLLLMLCLLAPLRSAAQEAAPPAASAWTFFPAERVFPQFLADGTKQQFSLGKDAATRRWIGSIGGLQHLVQLTAAGGVVLQAGIGATVYASLIRQPDVLQVLTADFFVDIPLELRLSDHVALRTGYGHHSGHLVDDGIEMLSLSSINYAKDYVPLFLAYTLPALGGFVYGGGRFDYYTIPEKGKHWILQGGMEGGNILVATGVRLYGTFDLKAKSEAAWGTTQSYQIGLKTLEEGMRAVRFAYTYRTGLDERGQFYARRISISLFGVYFDF